MILVDGDQTWLLSHCVTDSGISICVSGPEILMLHEHTITETDGLPLRLVELPQSTPTDKGQGRRR